MANKDFGVKKIELIGSSGTPKLSSPTNLNLDATVVAISTDVTIGGKFQSDVIVGSGFSVGIGSTQPASDLDINGNVQISGIVTSIGGFVSTANTTPITITWSGSSLTLSVSGIGSTTLTLS
jgi:hypothetical protein